MRSILLISLAIFSGIAAADQVENQTELALLPSICRGTQQIRNISRDTKPIEEYVAMYGQTYYHLHHYCWALNSENKSWRISDRSLRESKLDYALKDIQYVLDRADPDFAFLPEIYNSQARMLFTLRRDAAAVAALNKATTAKPDYIPAYLRLSNYFSDMGNKTEAAKILEQGIDNTEKANALIKALAKLGKTYQGVPGNKRKPADAPQENTPSKDSSDARATPADLPAAASPTPDGQKPSDTENSANTSQNPNPYCRFCP